MNGFISGQDTLTKKAAESFNTALPGLQFANLPFFPKKDLTSYPVYLQLKFSIFRFVFASDMLMKCVLLSLLQILLVSLVNGTIFIKDQYLVRQHLHRLQLSKTTFR
jgi:hypothetical protein